MGLELSAGSLNGVVGVVEYPPAFDVVDEPDKQSTFTVRRFVEPDLPAIKELDRQALSPDDQYSDEMYERFGAEDYRTLIAVSTGGEIAGYALLDFGTDPVRLRSLAVHPSHRRTGCGSELMRASLLDLSRTVDLFVEPENADAIRLYERFGFSFAGNMGEMPSRKRMLRCDANGATATIRHARPDEVEAVVRLHHLVRATSMPYLPVLHTVQEGIVFFAETVFRECDVLLAERESAIVGYLAYRDGWLDHLYIHPEYQGKGLGAALIERAMDAKDALHLWVFQRNARAIKFYERLGFRLLRTTDGRDNEEHEPDALYYWSRS